MLSNINRTLLLYLFVSVFVIVILVILGGTVITIIKSFRHDDRHKRKIMLTTLSCIVIAGISWIFNMGWVRFIMTFLLIPFIHTIVFFLINLFSSKYIQKSTKSQNIQIAFCATYLLFYVLLPDGGDVGEMYVFFGLIHSNTFSSICYKISSILFLSHIVLLILQIIDILKRRKSIIKKTE